MRFLAPVLEAFVLLARRLWPDTRGNITLLTALAGPVVALVAIGAVDLVAVGAAKNRFQSIADAGALAGAHHLALAVDEEVVREQAASFVESQFDEWSGAPDYEGAYEIVDWNGQSAIRVRLNGNRPSFFANLLPKGGWNFQGEATATSVGLVPLCVLVTSGNGQSRFDVLDAGRIVAPACMLHSNRDIKVHGGSITARAVQAVTSATGAISPAASAGAAPIVDPFAGLDLDRSGGLGKVCKGAELDPVTLSSGDHYISPGRHCGGIVARGTARVILRSGDHAFLRGDLVLEESARLEGQDVFLLFDKSSAFSFTGDARVTLDGRRSGDFAGLVIATMRGNQRDFLISADHVGKLLGVIYVPTARLVVDGSADVARESAWTVIVSRELRISGSPSLYINADYSASDVPVPTGVGPRADGSRLVH